MEQTFGWEAPYWNIWQKTTILRLKYTEWVSTTVSSRTEQFPNYKKSPG